MNGDRALASAWRVKSGSYPGSYARVISDVTKHYGLIREVRDSQKGQQKVELVALSNIE